MSEIRGDSLFSCVGNTPLLPLKNLGSKLPSSVQIFAKAEWFNPSGSFKDRVAISIINAALSTGELSVGKRLLDSTSGNMGIAYATFCAKMGIPITLVLPASVTKERIIIMRALGVELILSDGDKGSSGAMRLAREILASSPEKYFYANQYDNPANWMAHYKTTGPEIFSQTNGEITHFVAGMGTSGTLMGCGRYLREKNPQIEIIAVQPTTASHGLAGLKHMKSVRQPAIYDADFPNSFAEIDTEEARVMVRYLAHREGLFVGPSSGAAALAALQKAENLDKGVVVIVFPDSGLKYLSDRELWSGE